MAIGEMPLTEYPVRHVPMSRLVNRLGRLVGPALIAAGAVAIALALRAGGASFALVVIVPVFYGSSPLFALGVVGVIAGVFLLPLTFSSEEGGARPPRIARSPSWGGAFPPGTGTRGGAILIGPFPLFFGSWRSAPRWAYWVAGLVGVLIVGSFLVWALGR